ncbi:hypothetical protein TNCT_521471 [Trichonephila clavata]|uniref:Uncharacterized protein n=1 Tax=Trichonephila clavata TaxID=2740835 RepID=A0A8X6IB75_TRICU|nr:hypothetical protein TNCT_521471 [Trichonephila clavata]
MVPQNKTFELTSTGKSVEGGRSPNKEEFFWEKINRHHKIISTDLHSMDAENLSPMSCLTKLQRKASNRSSDLASPSATDYHKNFKMTCQER